MFHGNFANDSDYVRGSLGIIETAGIRRYTEGRLITTLYNSKRSLTLFVLTSYSLYLNVKYKQFIDGQVS